MNKLAGLDVLGKRVFLRADLDVPLPESRKSNGERLTADAELERSLRLLGIKPTVDYLRSHGASQIIIAGKIGRPKGKVDPSLSTSRIKGALEKILGAQIVFCDNIDRLPQGETVLLENMHFLPEELEPNEEFAEKLARLADVFVNENFASAHRNEASVSLLPKLLPHAVGIRFQREVEELTAVLQNPKRPLVAIIGGAKIETKIPVISNLSQVADYVLVGGYLPIEIKSEGLNFPSNVMVAGVIANQKDISLDSVNDFKHLIAGAGTVVINGPMGKYEDGFGNGTLEVAKAVVDSGAYSIVGGGNTEDFLQSKDLLSKFSFVSAGGGAMLEFLSGKKLPALEALG